MNSCRVFAALVLVVVASGAAAAQNCDQLPKGAVGWWPGDGSAVDLSSAANNGVLVNGTTFVPGVDGQGFLFDGLNDRIDVADAPALRPQRFTVAAWIQLDVAGQSACVVCKQFGTSTTNSYSLWMSGGVLRGGMFGIAEAIAPTALPAGRFVHAAFTYDGTSIRLYIDGQMIAIAAGPVNPVPYDTNQLIIGVDDNGVNFFEGFFKGIIDEPLLFGRALSNCEIRQLIQARSRGACKGDSDGDLVRDFQDNCPFAANAGQIDTDADGTGDICDCAPVDAQVYTKPGDYDGSFFTSKNRLDWCAEPAITGTTTVYDIIRGNLNELPVATGLSQCRSRCLTPLSGLNGWWPGDGTAAALVGSANGTLENGASIGAGLVGQGFVFDGVNDRVRTTNVTTGNALTVTAWVNSDVVNQGAYHRVVETAYNAGFFLGTDGSGTAYKFIVKNGAAPYGTAQGGTIAAGEWQFLAGTYDGGTGVGTLYVDGVAVGSGPFTLPGTVTLPVNIGAAAAGGIGWKGRVDEVQVYNLRMSAADIASLYESGSRGQCKAGLGGTDVLWTAPWDPEATIPAPGHGFWYVFHGNNSCGSGTYGFQTSGAERLSTICN